MALENPPEIVRWFREAFSDTRFISERQLQHSQSLTALDKMRVLGNLPDPRIVEHLRVHA